MRFSLYRLSDKYISFQHPSLFGNLPNYGLVWIVKRIYNFLAVVEFLTYYDRFFAPFQVKLSGQFDLGQGGLTQVEFAKKLGTTQAVITNYERGLRKPPADKIPDIAKILGVSLESIYGISMKDIPVEKKGSGTRREAQIEKIFRELPPAKQRSVLEHAKGLRKGKS